MRASEMSVVLQFPVHKLTWLKIVQNIQGMREGETAFLKKEGLDFINLKKLLKPSTFSVRGPNNRDGTQDSASLLHLGSFRTRGWGAGRQVALTSLRPRTSSRALTGHTEGTILPQLPTSSGSIFPCYKFSRWPLTRGRGPGLKEMGWGRRKGRSA